MDVVVHDIIVNNNIDSDFDGFGLVLFCASTLPHECTTQSDRPCLGVCPMHSAV